MKILKQIEHQGHEGAIYALEPSFNPEFIYSGGFDNVIAEWPLNENQPAKGLIKLPSKAFSIKKIKDNLLAIGTGNGSVHVVDVNTKNEIKWFQTHSDMVFDIQINPFNNDILSVGGDGVLSIYQSDLSVKNSIKLSDKKLRAIAFANLDVLIGCEDGSIKVLNAVDYSLKNEIITHEEGFGVNALLVDEQGQYLWSGSRDGHINVHDIKNEYELIHRIPAHYFAIYKLVFNPEMDVVMSVSRDKTMKFWQANDLKFIQKIEPKNGGHKASINAALWLDSNQIITTGDDRTIKVWKVF